MLHLSIGHARSCSDNVWSSLLRKLLDSDIQVLCLGFSYLDTDFKGCRLALESCLAKTCEVNHECCLSMASTNQFLR